MDIFEKIKSGEIKGYLTINRKIVFEGGVYHITQRAPGRELIFLEEDDYLCFLHMLKATVKRYNLDLFCFALLTNHLHLLLRINERNLSEAMKALFCRYAIFFNGKYKRKGHVFCGRYRASLCNDDNYLMAASVYIHLNAYKAGLSENPLDYRWSSISLYTGGYKKSFVNPKDILLILDHNMKNAQKRYAELLEDCMTIKGGTLLNAYLVKGFIKRISQKVNRIMKRNVMLEELIDNYRNKKRINTPKDKEARKYLVEQLIASGYPITAIARKLSLDRTTIYRILK